MAKRQVTVIVLIPASAFRPREDCNARHPRAGYTANTTNWPRLTAPYALPGRYAEIGKQARCTTHFDRLVN